MIYLLNNVAFSLGKIDIYWYGVLIAAGFVIAYFIYSLLAKKRNFPKDMPSDVLICSILGAIVGARLYYVVFEWNTFFVQGDFKQTALNILDVRHGGLAIYGGIIGAVICLAIYAKIKKFSLLKITDVATVPLVLGQAIGRWGNFFNQEAHGALVTNEKLQFFPYAVYLDSPKDTSVVGWYQATFFYESVWCLIVFGILLFLFFKQKYNGQLLLSYLALYGLERGIVEWLRTDQLLIGNVPVSAILSILLCITSFTLLIIFKAKKHTASLTAEEASKEE